MKPVSYVTLSIEGRLDDERRACVDDVVRRARGTATWRSSEAAPRSYALLQFPAGYDAVAIRAASGGTVYEKPVIALAVFPALPEALPPLLDALGGRGRPAGVLACIPCAAGAIVEWDPDLTETQVIVGLIDVELERLRSGRITELLSPLPPSLAATIAARGLQAPQIEPRRILELRIDRA